MPRPAAYQTAAEAIRVSRLADAGRLITVDGALTSNGDGFLIADPSFPTQLWDADGKCWQSRVFCSVAPTETAHGKFRLVLEPHGE